MPVRPATIADLLQSGKRPLYSFEFFPPKDEIQQRQLWQTVRQLEALGPDFVSVTYGASGSTRDRTITATEAIAQHTTLALDGPSHLRQPEPRPAPPGGRLVRGRGRTARAGHPR